MGEAGWGGVAGGSEAKLTTSGLKLDKNSQNADFK